MNETGFIGQITPYRLDGDEWITGIMIFCFIVTSYVFSHGRKTFFQSVRKLFSNHGINHIFHKQTSVDIYCLLLLNLQTCLLASVIILKCLSESPTSSVASNMNSSTISTLLGCYSGLSILYMLIKRYSYKFINWIFFDKIKNNLWMESYFFVVSIFGMLLFPVALLVVYGDFSFYISVLIPVFLFVLVNLFFIYKCFSIFFSQLHGLFHLFLYFCTLEILPLLVVWRGIEMVNDMLI